MHAWQIFLDQSLQSLQGKKILILGLGREGYSSYQFLRKHLPQVSLTLADQKELPELSEELQHEIRSDSAVDTQLGSDWLANLEQFDLIIKTPGISEFEHPQLQQLSASKLTSNGQLFFEVIQMATQQLHHHFITVGITGTKGKSTTTAMVHHLLKKAEIQTLLGGNIGIAPLDLLERVEEFDQSKPLYFVMELSAHQLQNLPYSPSIAIIQNITPEHLDYYPTFETYWQAKSNIARHQHISDLVILNPSFQTAARMADLSRAEQGYFVATSSQFEQLSVSKKDALLAHADQEFIWQNNHQLMACAEIPLRGTHNLENILPSVALAAHFQLSPVITRQAILSFRGLPHRLEFIEKINSISFYNDSLATTPEATISAISAFSGKRIALLVGGYDRHLEFTTLAKTIAASSVTTLVLFPDTGEIIKNELLKIAPKISIQMYAVSSMAEAFAQLKPYLSDLDIVLLSPAAASFNLFKDYADRGNQFKEQVWQLKQDLAETT